MMVLLNDTMGLLIKSFELMIKSFEMTFLAEEVQRLGHRLNFHQTTFAGFDLIIPVRRSIAVAKSVD